ncbi:MAG: class I SAM-dependent methyltransferase [Acidobacteria bacterium]|nr:class I SAM-dependent methyltransferase [Acidobacteriota bacterium]
MSVSGAAVHGPSACPRCDSEVYTTLFRGTDRLYGTTNRMFNVVECSNCALLRLDPMPSAAELAKFYPETYWWQEDASSSGRLAELYRQFVLRDHVRFVNRAIRREGPVLDIGCGGGSFLHALGKHGHDVVGSDISAKAAATAHKQYAIPATCSSLPRLPFRDGSFAAVTMFHVVEHLPDPMAALEAAWHLLAPGGRLVVQVPNAACWQMLLLGERWSGLDIPRHLIDFRAEDLEELLEHAGFEVRRRKYFSLRDNPAGLATSLAPSLDPMARKVRRVNESAGAEMFKNLLYFGLVMASAPLTLLEAAGAAGSTIMFEAARRGEE